MSKNPLAVQVAEELCFSWGCMYHDGRQLYVEITDYSKLGAVFDALNALYFESSVNAVARTLIHYDSMGSVISTERDYHCVKFSVDEYHVELGIPQFTPPQGASMTLVVLYPMVWNTSRIKALMSP